MTPEQDTIVTGLLMGWWIGAAYPCAGVIGIVLLGVAFIIANSLRRSDRGSNNGT